MNYKSGYIKYKNEDVFTIGYPLGKNPACASGKIINIYNFEFDHNISTEKGSSGCPIILLNNNTDIIKVIGIHKLADHLKKLNSGTFIGEIFNDNNNNFIKNIISNNILKDSLHDMDNSSIISDNNEELNKDNYITVEIDIKEDCINKDIRIINSYEEFKRKVYLNNEIKKDKLNENEIKKCEITINDRLIPFCYFYNFQNKGKYFIKYKFNNCLTKTNYLFCDCESLIKIDLSNFNTQKVSNMEGMFYGCKSLTTIDLSNFNTQNVKDMSDMFYGCKSLVNINLSNFDTQNVIDMSWMFYGCISLTNVDLSNFNTKNVIYMNSMFSECKSISNINLSNFNTEKVINMSEMFF